MAKIKLLPDRVANQIAAGEVIERPAAVVKELIENALDAGATRIGVEFRHAGRSLLRVEDNGHGMSHEDALLALERHATSKLAETTDLDRLTTFGFRGEALPSIASISRFTLQTRESGSGAGTEILVEAGRVVHARECGCPVGTRIDVEHLFEPVPARRKFLKSDRTEAAHIVHGVRLYALACPRASFTLVEEGAVVFRSPECPSLAERVGEIYGGERVEGMVPIEAEKSGLRLTGLIGRPGPGHSTRRNLVAFVNGRPVDSRTLNQAVVESFRDSVPQGRFPAAFLFLACDPAAVDVNVHPAKREVRFRDDAGVRSFVIRSVLERLREIGQSAATGSEATAARPPIQAASYQAPALRIFSVEEPARRFPAPASAPNPGVPSRSFARRIARDSKLPPFPDRPADPETADTAVARRAILAGPAWRFLGLAHGQFAVFEAGAGIILLDRRAAHERIWFERLTAQFSSGGTPSQRLLLPIPLPSDPIQSAMLLDHLEFLNRHGFEIAEFGRNFFRIEALPAWMEPADAEPFLRDLLAAFREGRIPVDNLGLAREKLARLAAAKAVRLPSSPGAEEMAAMLADLFTTRHPLASPSGRPTYLELDHGELARRFMAR